MENKQNAKKKEIPQTHFLPIIKLKTYEMREEALQRVFYVREVEKLQKHLHSLKNRAKYITQIWLQHFLKMSLVRNKC